MNYRLNLRGVQAKLDEHICPKRVCIAADQLRRGIYSPEQQACASDDRRQQMQPPWRLMTQKDR
jgi:hypothetical protein